MAASTNLHEQFEGRVRPLIDGKSLDSASNEWFTLMNPSNGRALLSLAAGCQSDVDLAVHSCRRAFEDGRWRHVPPSARQRTLHRFAELVEADATQLDAMDAEEMGKPISLALANAKSAAGLIRYYAEALDKVSGEVFSSDRTALVLQRRVPRGVVAAVVPWNFPTFNAALKLAPALAAGNCVVLKPSEHASRSAIHLACLALRAGLPAGVLNVVPGLGKTVGQALGRHADVDLLTFTGSTSVGKQMLKYAAESNMKVVMAECGGKSPHIVFADGVDLDAVSDYIARMLLTNQGQLCSVGSRLLVQRSIEGLMVEKVASRLAQFVPGNALEPKTTFGPLVSAQQCAQVMRHIDGALSEGAQLITGGRRTLLETGGYFVEPTLFSNVRPTSAIAQEEIFGPVLVTIPFDDEADAVQLANGTVYGLAAYVWTANLGTAARMSQEIRSSVWINAVVSSSAEPAHGVSYEPAGQSGFGAEGGMAGMESYLRRQLVWVNHT